MGRVDAAIRAVEGTRPLKQADRGFQVAQAATVQFEAELEELIQAELLRKLPEIRGLSGLTAGQQAGLKAALKDPATVRDLACACAAAANYHREVRGGMEKLTARELGALAHTAVVLLIQDTARGFRDGDALYRRVVGGALSGVPVPFAFIPKILATPGIFRTAPSGYSLELREVSPVKSTERITVIERAGPRLVPGWFYNLFASGYVLVMGVNQPGIVHLVGPGSFGGHAAVIPVTPKGKAVSLDLARELTVQGPDLFTDLFTDVDGQLHIDRRLAEQLGLPMGETVFTEEFIRGGAVTSGAVTSAPAQVPLTRQPARAPAASSLPHKVPAKVQSPAMEINQAPVESTPPPRNLDSLSKRQRRNKRQLDHDARIRLAMRKFTAGLEEALGKTGIQSLLVELKRLAAELQAAGVEEGHSAAIVEYAGLEDRKSVV